MEFREKLVPLVPHNPIATGVFSSMLFAKNKMQPEDVEGVKSLERCSYPWWGRNDIETGRGGHADQFNRRVIITEFRAGRSGTSIRNNRDSLLLLNLSFKTNRKTFPMLPF